MYTEYEVSSGPKNISTVRELKKNILRKVPQYLGVQILLSGAVYI